MIFNTDLTFEIIIKIIEDAQIDVKFESLYPGILRLDNISKVIFALFLFFIKINDNIDSNLTIANFWISNWYYWKIIDLIKIVAFDAIVFYKTLVHFQKA